MAQLVSVLEEIDARHPDEFHSRAASALVEFSATACSGRGKRDACAHELVPALLDASRGLLLGGRVRAAVLACTGGLGATNELRDLVASSGEEERSLLIGFAWKALGAPDPDAVRLDPSEFLSTRKRGPLGRFKVLPLPMARKPDEPRRAWLIDQILRPRVDPESFLSAELATLAIGTAVDADPSILEFLADRLRDNNPWLVRLHPAVGYVLSRSRSPAAREALRSFLEIPSTDPRDQFDRILIRYWMARGTGFPDDLSLLAAPLLDGQAPIGQMEMSSRIVAAASLLQRADPRMASPAEIAEVENILSACVRQSHEPDLHPVMVSMLSAAAGGMTRLLALEQVLRFDPDADCRQAAAIGIGDTPLPQDDQARVILQRALSGESDREVRAKILQALDEMK